ncbi:hypothetical protein GIB67_041194 [Kingdonia uniflora]|uniref:O-methyltransferase C-terminal domain-containing protein n=1 Tax=Kingdonia uniflora TaxID=39325 RepID=A0A7J7MIK9_9MAGN|nr:hypothetical protein GIB67_041194 [Kingdonia uniflora]
MAAFLLLESSPVMLAPWHAFSGCVPESGKPAFEAAHGVDVWGYASGDPEHSELINEAMACDARLVVPAILEDCPSLFDGFQTVVDVGGGNGTTLGMLVKAYPWLKGTNFDLPHVASVAPKIDNVEHVGGDFFVNIPKADAAFVMWSLHDWGDEECINILRKCKEAIPKDGGKVIIVEAVIDEVEEHEFKDVRYVLDMVMMAHTSAGKERTQEDWTNILRESGFSRHTIYPIRAIQAVIVAWP